MLWISFGACTLRSLRTAPWQVILSKAIWTVWEQVTYAQCFLGITSKPRPRLKTRPGKRFWNSEWFYTFAPASQWRESRMMGPAHHRDKRLTLSERERDRWYILQYTIIQWIGASLQSKEFWMVSKCSFPLLFNNKVMYWPGPLRTAELSI